ncbi:ABC transporter permease [Meiothermus sp. QL-1]|uniref:ABC transporter permease n=1 Tax=Meiothermus sp. QL-1 TaxID=2058095 RepID=UPI000E0B6D08|nr:ABC transporter permease [Meiothermus sp. QL-1]RDI95784.1 ABC transporter permease [Meiothermus sp. QL-1]
MKHVLKIAWKELVCYLREERILGLLLLPLLIMPLLMYAPYWVLARLQQQSAARVHLVAVKEVPPELLRELEQKGLRTIPVPDPREAVRQRRADVGLEFAKGTFIVYDRTSPVSTQESVANLRLKEVLQQVRQRQVEQQLAAKGLSQASLEPFRLVTQKAASQQEQALGLLALVLPVFILLAVLGAGQHVALDATVGEKQMGTIEALLSAPIEPWKLLLGKGLAVLGAAFFSAISVFVGTAIGSWASSRGLLAQDNPFAAPTLPTGSLALSLPTLGGLFLTGVLFAVFAVGLVLSVGIFARSYREASAYLSPLDLLVMAPMLVFAFGEYFQPQIWHYALPGLGVVMALEGLVKDSIGLPALLTTWLTTLGYTFLTVYAAYWSFRREDAVFRN